LIAFFNFSQSPSADETAAAMSGKKFVPLVVRWNGEGKDVYVVGNFEQRKIPMNKRSVKPISIILPN